MLGNLLSNAVKYAAPGGSIVVRAELHAPEHDRRAATWVAVHVSDDGPGIPEDQHERIFEEFTRLDHSGQPGSGLGLAIARRVARLLGGDITLASAAGRGSTFTLWLPAGEAAGSSDARARRGPPEPRQATSDQGDAAAAARAGRPDGTTRNGEFPWKRWSRNGRMSYR